MNKQIKKTTIVLFAAGCLAGTSHAEFGVSAGASFNYKANFRSSVNSGAAVAGADHFYDDGYNRVDSSGNAGNQTTYWGYQNASQYDPAGDGGNGTITMHSTMNSSESQEEAQPALEIYWQHDFTENERWNIGVRTAVRWQRIEIDNTATTIADAYSLGGIIPPGAPFDGSFAGPNAVLSDTPVRTLTAGATRTIDANLFGFDFGPTLSLTLTEKLRLTASVGGTVAWIRSDFSYSDGTLASGSDTKQDWLLGTYAGADLQYQIGEHWGIFAGAAYTCLQDFNQQAGDRSAELEFGDSYTLRSGLFFQ